MAPETPNHGYKRPNKGASDWHIPINENFEQLDAAVEIRGQEAERDSYQPRDGAKYLATDTRRVFLGDGDQWLSIGRLAPSGQTIDGVRVPRPGNIQATIDQLTVDTDYGQAPTRTVRLRAGKTYHPDQTITIKPNVRLDCNGARIVPDGDFDIFELRRGTRLIDPFCDTRRVNWSSTQVVIGPENADKLGAPNRAWVENAYLIGTNGEGIGIQFRGGEAPCGGQRASGYVRGFDRAVDFYAAGSDSGSNGAWSNGNRFVGHISHYRTGISMRSEGAPVTGNVVQVQAQPQSDTSEWLWSMRPGGGQRDEVVMKGNNVVAYPWDVQSYTDNNPAYKEGDRRAPIWFLGAGQVYANALWDLSGRLSNSFMLNNSNAPNRNGVFTAHGGFVTGTSQFKSPPIYEPNTDTRWHAASENQ